MANINFILKFQADARRLGEAEEEKMARAEMGLSSRMIPYGFNVNGGQKYWALNDQEYEQYVEWCEKRGRQPAARLNEDGTPYVEPKPVSAPIMPFFPQSKSATKSILPPPATIQRKPLANPALPTKPILNIDHPTVRGDELYKRYRLEWGGIGVSKDVTNDQMETYAKTWLSDHLKTYQQEKDAKYIDLVHADKNYFEFRFAVERWLYDNFNSMTPTYRPVASLEFEVRKPFPLFFIYESQGVFLANKFEQFMHTRKTKLLNANFSFLKSIDVNMFEFKYIHQGSSRFVAVLRQTVIIGALAIYTSVFFNKKLTKDQEEQVKKSASRFSDTDNLNRFLKSIK